MYIILSIVIFGFLILVHELGHFLAAKLLGVKVNEFSLCMGPAIFQKTVGETTYSIRCLPIGGYCAMEGEDGQSEDPRAFSAQKPWKRLIILIAGVFNNFLTGVLILAVLFCSASRLTTTTIEGFTDGCVLQGDNGLQPGDQILSIDGERVYILSDVSMLLERGRDTYYDVVVLRDEKRVELKQYAFEAGYYTVDGETVYRYGINFLTEENSIWKTLKYSLNSALDFGRMVRMGLVDLLTGRASVKNVTGVVGIVSTMNETGNSAETTADGVRDVLYFGAFLAVNLAFTNLLPVPALDGGRIFFLLVVSAVEALSKRCINPKYENYVHAAGMVLLLAMMAVVTMKDIISLF